MGTVITSVLIGVIAALMAAAFIEYLRLPKLRLSIETPPIDVHYANQIVTDMRTVRILVLNKPLPRWMLRASAPQCRAEITFHHLNTGHDVFRRAMDGRWAKSPEPIAALAIYDMAGTQTGNVFDPARIALASTKEITPGESQPLDIAIKADADTHCFGWNNEAYFSIPSWRNRRWQLPSGQYLVKVVIKSAGQNWADTFRLVNDVPRTDFRLEPATKAERARVTE